jgi:hypothetical protein
MTARPLTTDDIPELARQIARELASARRPKKPRRELPKPSAAAIERARKSLRRRGVDV